MQRLVPLLVSDGVRVIVVWLGGGSGCVWVRVGALIESCG